MKVNQYTQVSYETISEEVPVVTTTYEIKSKSIRKEEQVFEVELTQEQVDVIVAVFGNVIGGGSVREITDDLWGGLHEYATKGDNGIERKYSFKDYFKVKESSYNDHGYLVVKEGL